MPEIGEIKKASELGYKSPTKYMWRACIDCGKERWIQLSQAKRQLRCPTCSGRHITSSQNGEQNPYWKGGRIQGGGGYIRLRVSSDDFFFPMANKIGYVAEHRLVMAKYLGRCLQSWEFVHHKNGDRSDNRLENLELTTKGSHILEHSKGYRDGYQKGLADGRNKQIAELKAQNDELLKHIKLIEWQFAERQRI